MPDSSSINAIIVHGGAWDIPAELHAEHLSGCRAAARAGWEILVDGGSAIEAVEAAVRIMEDAPVFDAGRGSHLNSDGIVELDAAMMDGATLRAGAVAAVHRIANPITLARHVLHESPHVFLVAHGAERFALEIGLALCEPEDLVVPRERTLWERHRADPASTQADRVFRPAPADTVGAIARDHRGNLAAGNSTGGTFYKAPGRVGDTPIIGCGLYADNTMGAAACTGYGEQIMKTVLAKTTVDQIALLRSANDAARVAVAYFQHRVQGLGGVICISPDGQIGFAHSTPFLAHAYMAPGMDDIYSAMRADA